ncbi:MAG: cation diffusion facilitator family transporter [Flavobacteriales bacterium]|jgi:cation diffusion facilitator family transporter|nr:cation diffusion facilitator family transporter [Flavobacteriales bacterium]MCW8912248.1 cation diffusion facilitator family transporter [Flavobacteriales bacterium]MCW8937513.1 cation diffusion facilitator family transporter [Flavobacteriales bacterium]MCW8941165.1 cation diffusion facilitator family transporter [Flavobacteriales bacterium]MCW8967162.1 cation diffusion facilitator family transporter [Flavobacteriales bacterium]
MPIERENYNFQKIVAFVGIVLLAIKLAAWYITDSVAILTDALEGIVNVIAAFIGLYSLYLSAQPKDSNHPYGHGKVEFISAGIEGVMIAFAGVWVIFEAINHIINPQEIKQIDLGILLIVFAGLTNFIVGYLAVKKGKKNNSIALISSGKHLISDTYTTLGVIIGLVIIKTTSIYWLDSVFAMVFGIIIIFTGIKILRQSVAGIMDEADTQLLKNMVATLNENRVPNWIDLHNLRIIKFGSRLHIDCHLTVPWYLNVKEAHEEVDAIEALIQKKYGNNIELFVHSDYCKPKSCEICTKVDCDVRVKPFVQQIAWNLDNVASNKKHQIVE